jgi:hypothetical protein
MSANQVSQALEVVERLPAQDLRHHQINQELAPVMHRVQLRPAIAADIPPSEQLSPIALAIQLCRASNNQSNFEKELGNV